MASLPPPAADPRRAGALRAELAAGAAVMVPGWAGIDDAGDVGAALYEIAARLAEQSTRRLDQTPLRDKLAFLDTLAIPPTPPRAATAPIVFTLTEKRLDPVFAPRGVQAVAKIGDAEIAFETSEAIALTTARLGAILAIDPATDRIEQAPLTVIGTPRGSAAARYRAVSPSVTGSLLLQLAQMVGITPGDLLRVDGRAYRVAKIEGDIVTLLDPLEAPVGVASAIERIVRLDAFDLRDVQEHAVYFGHGGLLKLDRPAAITLALEPVALTQRLTALDVSFALWGTPKGQPTGWHDLGIGGAGGDGLRLIKPWEGSVDETKIAGRKSRWLRVKLNGPIDPSAPPQTRAVSAAIKVRSLAPAATADGSLSIVAAYHNSLPLPLTAPFYPFGPEPQRFDTFAIAAPEALSKKGARVTLAVTLTDASPAKLVLAAGRSDRGYGIGIDGRLQAFTIAGDAITWQRLDHPPEEPGAAGPAAGSLGALRLDGTRSLASLRLDPSRDAVVACDTLGRLWHCIVSESNGGFRTLGWTFLAPPEAEWPAWRDVIILRDSGSSWFTRGMIVAAHQTGFYRRGINIFGGADPGWSLLAGSGDAAAIDLSGPLALTPLLGIDWPDDPATDDHVLAAADNLGFLYLGELDAVAGAIAWRSISTVATPAADAAVHPVLVALRGGALLLAAAASGDGELFSLRITSTTVSLTQAPTFGGALAGTTLLCLPSLIDADAERPVIVGLGATVMALWTDDDRIAPIPLPVDTSSDQPSTGMLVPAGNDDTLPSIIVNGAGETLFQARFERVGEDVHATLYDAVALPAADPAPDAIAIGPLPATLRDLDAPVLRHAGGDLYAIDRAAGLATDAYRVFDASGGVFSGTQDTTASRLILSASDSGTRAGDFVAIDGRVFEVQSIDDALDPPVAHLTAATGQVSGATVSYRRYRSRLIDGAAVAHAPPERLATLANIDAAAAVPHAASLGFASPAAPRPQLIAAIDFAPAEGIWMLLADAWTTLPAGTAATLESALTVSPWTSTRFSRDYANPELAWEYFNGSAWRRLDTGLIDLTGNFAGGGDIGFDVPADLAEADVAGQTDLWIRARLVGGDYGRATYVVDIDNQDPAHVKQSIRVDTSELNPPEIRSIEASYALAAGVAPDQVLTSNNLAIIDETQAALADGAQFDLFVGIDQHVDDARPSGRTLYCRLTRAPAVAVLNLFVDAVEADLPGATLNVEVLTATGWAAVPIDDATSGLLRPGLLRVFLNAVPAELPLFGAVGWWIRLRADADDWAPSLRGVYVNAAMAEQAKTVRQEILGSSLGEPRQTYALTQPPVLPDSLDLRVRETLSDEEQAGLIAAFGADVIAAYPNIDGQWVRWRRVDSFAGLGGDARAYVLDAATGMVVFGSGRRGKAPPAGRDAIRAAAYQTGGGSIGNVPALAINRVKSAIASLESAVNPVEASGGADAPAIETLARTAPARLRHAGRALTASDVEAMALASAPDIVAARCLAGNGGGYDLVVSVRQPGVRCPVPTRARREGIARDLAALGWGVLTAEAINVRPPRFARLALDIALLATGGDMVAALESVARAALLDLLDPAIGPDGTGRRFGDRLWPSDVQRALAPIAGLDRVEHLAIAAIDRPVGALPPDTLACCLAEDITLTVRAESGA